MRCFFISIIMSVFVLGVIGCDFQQSMTGKMLRESAVKKGAEVSLSRKVLHISEGTTMRIKKSQFDFTKFTSLIVPKSAEIIGKRAFYNHNFSSVYLFKRTDLIKNETFAAMLSKAQEIMPVLAANVFLSMTANGENISRSDILAIDEFIKDLAKISDSFVFITFDAIENVNDKILSDSELQTRTDCYSYRYTIAEIYSYWSTDGATIWPSENVWPIMDDNCTRPPDGTMYWEFEPDNRDWYLMSDFFAAFKKDVVQYRISIILRPDDGYWVPELMEE